MKNRSKVKKPMCNYDVAEQDGGMNPFLKNIEPEKKPVPVQGDYVSDEDAGIEIQYEQPIETSAPPEYTNAVIGETMLSLCETLKQLSLHDVMLSWPRLIKDLVNDAYVKGITDASNKP